MEVALCNAAADATDVTRSQSVQDGGRIKHNHYAFHELASWRCNDPACSKRSAGSSGDPGRHIGRKYLHIDDENVTGVFNSSIRSGRAQPPDVRLPKAASQNPGRIASNAFRRHRRAAHPGADSHRLIGIIHSNMVGSILDDPFLIHVLSEGGICLSRLLRKSE
jgi:hypothetical protein